MKTNVAWSGMLCLGALLVGLFASVPAYAESAVGLWQTISDTDGKPKSYVRISEVNGELRGVVETILDPAKQDKRCDQCEDERKDQRVLGMTILRSAHLEGDVYVDGKILDPENGKVYRCHLTVIDQGRRLHLRGYIGIPLFGRTQTWNRVQ